MWVNQRVLHDNRKKERTTPTQLIKIAKARHLVGVTTIPFGFISWAPDDKDKTEILLVVKNKCLFNFSSQLFNMFE